MEWCRERGLEALVEWKALRILLLVALDVMMGERVLFVRTRLEKPVRVLGKFPRWVMLKVRVSWSPWLVSESSVMLDRYTVDDD